MRQNYTSAVAENAALYNPPEDMALAHQYDSQGRHDEALRVLRNLAAGRDLGAMTYLGARLLLGRSAPCEPKEAVLLLHKAARQGGAEAALTLANLSATGEQAPQSWTNALGHLARAAELGAERAQAQLALLAGGGARASWAAGWAALAKGVRVADWLRPPSGRVIWDEPRASVVEGFLRPEVCDWIAGRARPLLRRADVFDQVTGASRHDERRSNSSAYFDLLTTDVVLSLVRARVAAAVGSAPKRLEASQVLHYAVGQRFDLHFDFLNTAAGGFASAEHGQRVKTVIVYLNDDFEGGETHFPRLPLNYRGKKGDALIFSNVDAAGLPDRRTLHAGLPPTEGEKWVLSHWVRG